MRLYIANVARQRQVVHYRINYDSEGKPFEKVKAVKQQPIGKGQQVTIGGDMFQTTAQDIMDQLRPVGGIGVDELKSIPNFHVAYLLSLNRVITKKEIDQVMQHNNIFLMRSGEKRRKQAAIGTSAAVENVVKAEAELRRFDVEIEQIDRDTEKTVDEGFHTIPVDGRPPEVEAPRARRGKRG